MGTNIGMKFAIVLLSLAGMLAAQSKPAADLIITNANVWTGDDTQPKAQAVAVLGDRIVAVGSNADIHLWRGPQTKTLDAGASCCSPGSMMPMFTSWTVGDNWTTFNLTMPPA